MQPHPTSGLGILRCHTKSPILFWYRDPLREVIGCGLLPSSDGVPTLQRTHHAHPKVGRLHRDAFAVEPL